MGSEGRFAKGSCGVGFVSGLIGEERLSGGSDETGDVGILGIEIGKDSGS